MVSFWHFFSLKNKQLCRNRFCKKKHLQATYENGWLAAVCNHMSFELLKWHISLNSGFVQVQILLPVWKGFVMIIPAGNNARQPLVGQPFHKNHSFHQLLWCLQERHWKCYHPRQFLADYICTNVYVKSRKICKITTALAWAYYLVVLRDSQETFLTLSQTKWKLLYDA